MCSQGGGALLPNTATCAHKVGGALLSNTATCGITCLQGGGPCCLILQHVASHAHKVGGPCCLILQHVASRAHKVGGPCCLILQHVASRAHKVGVYTVLGRIPHLSSTPHPHKKLAVMSLCTKYISSVYTFSVIIAIIKLFVFFWFLFVFVAIHGYANRHKSTVLLHLCISHLTVHIIHSIYNNNMQFTESETEWLDNLLSQRPN